MRPSLLLGCVVAALLADPPSDRDHGIVRRVSEPADEVAAAIAEFIEELAIERGAKP